jgi:hypothetical protein
MKVKMVPLTNIFKDFYQIVETAKKEIKLKIEGEDIESENNNEMNSKFIKGIIKVRDEIIPIVDLAKK